MSHTLDVYYDFSRKELRIKFNDPQHAQQYQMINREARIYGGDDKSIWIPIPPDVQQLRASAYGFILCFTSGSKASDWCRRVALGQLYNYNDGLEEKDAYISREWDKADLERRLRGSSQGLVPPKDRTRTARSPALRNRGDGHARRLAETKDDEGFGVEAQKASRSSP